jgi:SAM-dependent methyltransferase
MTEQTDADKDAVRENAKRIAKEHLEKGDAIGWFDELYAGADGDHEQIPWADLEPNRFLVKWAEDVGFEGNGRTALVIGCGLGDDAKYLYQMGFKVTAFDVSQKAIEWAKRIHAETDIVFQVADLFNSPGEWERAFDMVLEVYTVQALPLNLRDRAIDGIAGFVRQGGELVVVERHRENDEEPAELPWALSPNDLCRFEKSGLTQVSRNEYLGDEEPPITRFVVVFKKITPD